MNLLMVDPAETAGPSPDGLMPDSEADDLAASTELLQRIVTDHYQAAYRYAYRLTGSVSDAEDVTQQTFLVAQSKLYQLRDPDKVDRWLFAVLRSCYLKSRRKPRPIPAAALELNVDELPEEAVRQLEHSDFDQERFQQALNQLSDEHKVVLLMFYLDELSYKEISAQLNVKIGTVMSRLSRAKGWLRKWLLSFDDAGSSKELATARLPVSGPTAKVGRR
jgi:RNA polymerase sigma-70 factor, ECF subfamily